MKLNSNLVLFWGLLSVSLMQGCMEQRCYDNADCSQPKYCDTSNGQCVYECLSSSDCGIGFVCADHHCSLAATDEDKDGDSPPLICPSDMVKIGGTYCIDRFEASRIDATSNFTGNDNSKARSAKGVLPWKIENNAAAEAACNAVSKRLCTPAEWTLACKGPDGTAYAYGNSYDPTTCNGIDAFGREGFHLAPTGSFPDCTNEWGVFDINGNLWEHVAQGDDQTVRGGAYNCMDSAALHRCDYIPGSWTPSARGFRCCLSENITIPDGDEERIEQEAEWEFETSESDEKEEGGCLPDGDVDMDESSETDWERETDRMEESPEFDAPWDDEKDKTDPDPELELDKESAACPLDMSLVGSICMDRFEASRSDATSTNAGSDNTRALSRPGVLPWYVSSVTLSVRDLFSSACAAAGKRLCTPDEWLDACKGPTGTTYFFGDTWNRETCNNVDVFCDDYCAEHGISPCSTNENCGYQYTCFHVMPTGSFPDCSNEYGLFDVNGNVWEIVPSASDSRGYEVRGGAFNCGNPSQRLQCPFNAGWNDLYAGFRCCKERNLP